MNPSENCSKAYNMNPMWRRSFLPIARRLELHQFKVLASIEQYRHVEISTFFRGRISLWLLHQDTEASGALVLLAKGWDTRIT